MDRLSCLSCCGSSSEKFKNDPLPLSKRKSSLELLSNATLTHIKNKEYLAEFLFLPDGDESCRRDTPPINSETKRVRKNLEENDSSNKLD
jgi:hypothetical protein